MEPGTISTRSLHEAVEKKAPLVALLIAPDPQMRADILSGMKRITIREGHRDYRPGPVMLCCHLEPWAVLTRVETVAHKLLGEVSDAELLADGFANRAELLAGMRRFYPTITMDSPVTVIEWAYPVAGKLFNDYRAPDPDETR